MSTATPDDADVVSAVSKAEQARCTLANDRNWDGLANLLADEMIYSHSTAQVEDKAAWIEGLMRSKRYFFRDSLTVHPYGDMAITRGGVIQIVLDDEGRPANPLLVSSLQVWIEREGRWQLLANHNTRTPIVR